MGAGFGEGEGSGDGEAKVVDDYETEGEVKFIFFFSKFFFDILEEREDVSGEEGAKDLNTVEEGGHGGGEIGGGGEIKGREGFWVLLVEDFEGKVAKTRGLGGVVGIDVDDGGEGSGEGGCGRRGGGILLCWRGRE